MAKIYSHSVGRAKGSIGLVTYRTVKGRTLASQKVQPRGTRGDGEPKYTNYTYAFALMSLYALYHKASINKSFDPVKYGTARNAFAKYNFGVFKLVADYLLSQGDSDLWTDPLITYGSIENVVGIFEGVRADMGTDAYNMVRVRKRGFAIEILQSMEEWNDIPDPTPFVAPSISSVDFYRGYDTVDGAYYGWSIYGSNLAVINPGSEQQTINVIVLVTKSDGTQTDMSSFIASKGVATTELTAEIEGAVPTAYDGTISILYEDPDGKRHTLVTTEWRNIPFEAPTITSAYLNHWNPSGSTQWIGEWRFEGTKLLSVKFYSDDGIDVTSSLLLSSDVKTDTVIESEDNANAQGGTSLIAKYVNELGIEVTIGTYPWLNTPPNAAAVAKKVTKKSVSCDSKA